MLAAEGYMGRPAGCGGFYIEKSLVALRQLLAEVR